MGNLRIEQRGMVAMDTKVFYVDGDVETDISSCLTGVDLHMEIGSVVTATLTGLVREASVHDVRAESVLVELERIQRSRLPWHRRRLRDLTTFGSRVCRWAHA